MFRRQFNFDPSAEPPDLVVRIQATSSPGRYIWSCVSPHMPLPLPAAPEDAEMTLHSDAENFVRSLFEPLVGKVLKKLHISEIRGIGEAIYRSTPKVFKDAYWLLHRSATDRKFRFESVLIVTDEPCIPWELMRILDDSSPPVPAEFLGIRHSVGRWLSSKSQAPLQRIPITAVAVAASDYQHVDAVEGKLPWVKEEKALLRDRYSAKPIELRSEPLIDFLMQGGVEMFHLACHGQMSVVSPLTSELIMEDTPENLRPTMVDTEEVRDNGLGKRKPLVFLNACEAGGAARSLSLVAGFPAAFLGGGAAAVVSPLWSINDERAKEIAECFYEAALGDPPKTVGEVMKHIRSKWVDRELTFLAYVLYGDPLLRLELRR